jgi:hypothetical protein
VAPVQAGFNISFLIDFTALPIKSKGTGER